MIDQSEPIEIRSLTGKGIIDIAISFSSTHYMARTNSSCYSWGNNQWGQLGHGDTLSRPNPTLMTLLPDPTRIEKFFVGATMSLVVLNDGRVFSFGDNSFGQCGVDSRDAYVPKPTRIRFLYYLLKVSLGRYHNWFLTTVFGQSAPFAFGSNGRGELGLGGTDIQWAPTTSEGLTNLDITDISAGTVFSIAVNSTGAVYVMGENRYGEAGTGSWGNQYSVPTLNPILSKMGIIRVIAGEHRTFAISRDHIFYSSGRMFDGRLGIYDGAGSINITYDIIVPIHQPIPILSGKEIETVSMGHDHTFVKTGGVWYSFGPNQFGENAIGVIGPQTSIQKAHYTNSRRVHQIVTGFAHTLFLDDEEVYGFGLNSYGQLGLGDSFNRFNPVRITKLGRQNISRIFAGSYFSFAICGNRTVWSFGQNSFGQLGLGDRRPTFSPTIMHFFTGIALLDIQIGLYHTIALTTDNFVYSWGNNEFGHLGLREFERNIPFDKYVPTRVADLDGKGIIKIATGAYHTIALSREGLVYGFGTNGYGQLGHPAYFLFYLNMNPGVPIRSLSALNKITMIACGYWHTVIANSTHVFTLGRNTNGQVGDMKEEFTNQPYHQKDAPSDISKIKVSGNQNFFLLENRTVFGYGANYFNQLGMRESHDLYTPSLICTRTVDLFPGFEFTIFVLEDELRCFEVPATDSSVCSNRGTCIGFDKCLCNSQYGGSDCSKPVCFGHLSDDPSACNGHGACQAPDLCECDFGRWCGVTCNVTVCFGKKGDDAYTCSGRGFCSENSTCNCLNGYQGKECEFPICFGKSSVDSSVCTESNGKCIAPDTCQCDSTKFVGKKCETPVCFGKNATNEESCGPNGNCTSAGLCMCRSGFIGSICGETVCYGHLSNSTSVCTHNGICVGPDTCQCLRGFLGDKCRIHFSTVFLSIFGGIFIFAMLVNLIMLAFDFHLIRSLVIYKKPKFDYRTITSGELREKLLEQQKLIN